MHLWLVRTEALSTYSFHSRDYRNLLDCHRILLLRSKSIIYGYIFNINYKNVPMCQIMQEKRKTTIHNKTFQNKKKQNILLFAIAIIVPFNWMQNIIFVSILSSKRQYIYVYYIVELYKSFLYQKRLCFTKPTSEWENIPELPVHRSCRRVGPVSLIRKSNSHDCFWVKCWWNMNTIASKARQKNCRDKCLTSNFQPITVCTRAAQQIIY